MTETTNDSVVDAGKVSPYALIAQVFDQAQQSDAPLSARLRMLAEAVRQGSPRFFDTVDAMVARLEQVGLGQNAPAVGETMPPFMLPDQDRKLVSLTQMLASGPAVISFYRGHWCPYCRLTANAFAEAQDRIGRAQMVAITPETRSFNARLIERTGIGFRVLTDPDSGYALSLNLAFWLDDGFADMMRSFGLDLSIYQAKGAWMLPVPATFVVDRQGVVIARHVDPDYRRRIEVDDLVAAFEQAL
jgi:peroxiredoxin